MYFKRKIDCLLHCEGGRGLFLGHPDALGTHHSYRQDLGLDVSLLPLPPLPPPHVTIHRLENTLRPEIIPHFLACVQW